MDEIDQAFLASLLPDGARGIGFICGATFILEDGTQAWRCYNTLDCSLSEIVGLLDLMKFWVLGHTPGVVHELGFRPS